VKILKLFIKKLGLRTMIGFKCLSMGPITEAFEEESDPPSHKKLGHS
jgi:hypothetical protein